MKPALLLALSPGAMSAAHADILLTPSFIVNIEEDCGTGDVHCSKVSYTGTSKKTGQAIVLRRKAVHAACRKDEEPCEFQGNVFKNGATSYRVTKQGELIVSKGAKILVQETGEWK
ncbi:hypothetical protein F2P44_16545 [Massilia sp. CCM 8695]|uniref:DUF2845 domain-containing protein n=1 Tax=Massilia frigida TaxID=2609281 RepID=A0ABX0NE99_9BURK|nr:hypothetical protein [Massilia frigida]NHZ80871.1 hypothetical protein [Massilia frigida]